MDDYLHIPALSCLHSKPSSNERLGSGTTRLPFGHSPRPRSEKRTSRDTHSFTAKTHPAPPPLPLHSLFLRTPTTARTVISESIFPRLTLRNLANNRPNPLFIHQCISAPVVALTLRWSLSGSNTSPFWFRPSELRTIPRSVVG